MDAADTLSDFSGWAVLVAGASAFVLGGLWYGPLFGSAWQTSAGLSKEDLAARKLPLVFTLAGLAALLAAANLEAFIGPERDLAFGLFAGAAAGLGWVAAFLAIIYLFEGRPLKLFLINGGYCAVALTLMGAILGAW